MRVTVTFDSWAWIEYFKGSKAGSVADEYLQSSEQICTPALGLLEIKSKYLKEGKPFQDEVEFICRHSRIVNLDKESALKAAELKASGLHTSDAIIYATAQSVASTLLTGDPHFKGLAGVQII